MRIPRKLIRKPGKQEWRDRELMGPNDDGSQSRGYSENAGGIQFLRLTQPPLHRFKSHAS
jgi:hypothetical protein